MKEQKNTAYDIANVNDTKSWLNNISLPKDYKISEEEEYMNDLQLKYFQEKLLNWKKMLILESEHTLELLKNKSLQEADDTDRASSETDTNIELRTRERYLKLIAKIDYALNKIENKTYGYCEETGDEIGIKRLDARPIANLTVKAQEEHEQKKRMMQEQTEEDLF